MLHCLCLCSLVGSLNGMMLEKFAPSDDDIGKGSRSFMHLASSRSIACCTYVNKLRRCVVQKHRGYARIAWIHAVFVLSPRHLRRTTISSRCCSSTSRSQAQLARCSCGELARVSFLLTHTGHVSSEQSNIQPAAAFAPIEALFLRTIRSRGRTLRPLLPRINRIE